MGYELEYLSGYTPADFGFGEEFPEFRRDPRTGREVQLEAIEFAAYSDKRFVGMSVPTGVGKSLIAASLAKLTGMRTVVLTGTKGLQAQYESIFSKYGLVTIQGRANYPCMDHGDQDCRSGVMLGCRCTNGKGCTYELAKARACESSLVSANYAYWMNVNDRANGLERGREAAEFYGENPVELLVCDEADSAREWVEGYLSVRVYENDIKRWADGKEVGDEYEVWAGLSEIALREYTVELANAVKVVRAKGRGAHKEDVENVGKLEKLVQKFERIRGFAKNEVVIEKREGTRWGRMWCFDVVWPGRYTEKYLFCGVPKVVLMSATLKQKELGLLGVSKEKSEFREWPRVFPANRNPIYSIPARTDGGKDVRIDRHTSVLDLIAWVDHIDRIIDGRLDRKGIVQTVSYDRQRFLLEHSRHADLFMGNTNDPDSDSAQVVAEEFRRASAPKILVSPSFARGWDFPGESCEYTVICKVPFKSSGSKVQKVREERDKEYGPYQAMQELVQMVGRGMRSFEDRNECFIVDGHLGWFLAKYKHLAPEWFGSAVRRMAGIPDAAEKLSVSVNEVVRK